jgi:hypothetical protein
MGACQACSIFLCCRVCRSAAYHVLQFFRIPSPLHRDLGDPRWICRVTQASPTSRSCSSAEPPTTHEINGSAVAGTRKVSTTRGQR